MKLEFDDENNLAYLTLIEGETTSVQQKAVELSGGTVIIDIDNEGAVIGLEFFNASTLLRHAKEPPPPAPIPPDYWETAQ